MTSRPESGVSSRSKSTPSERRIRLDIVRKILLIAGSSEVSKTSPSPESARLTALSDRMRDESASMARLVGAPYVRLEGDAGLAA